jgi:hypothetical protein
MPVMGVAKFKRFFRVASGLEVDKSDLVRYDNFIHHTLYDLLTRAEAISQANNRGVIDVFDLPITAGLQKCVHVFEKLDEEIELEPVLERLATHPPLDRLVSESAEAELPRIAGGLSVALARAFTIIDPKLVNPSTPHWEQAFELFDLLV